MSAYIKLSTLEYPRHIGDIQLDPAGMADYAPVEWVDRPTFNSERERCYIGNPVNLNGVWKTSWIVEQIPDSEQADKLRLKRNEFLKECDWTQLEDSPVNKVVWAAYRKSLRDLPEQSGFPWEVVWPQKP